MSLRRAWARRGLGIGLLGLAALPAAAQDLAAVWRAAEQHDRTLAVARAEHAAAQTKREQAQALWRPNVMLGLGAGLGAGDMRMKNAQFSAPGMGTSEGVNFRTSVNAGLATRANLVAQQPLLNPGRDAARAQLALGADMGDVAWRAARSQLMLRTAERYFALAVAEEQLRVTERQAESVARAATEAHDRFQLGDVPVTDTHEADAALAGVRAQVEAARLQRDLARQSLADSTGLPQPVARLPAQGTALGETLQSWIDAAQAANPQAQLAAHGVRLAEHELRRRRAGDSVSVDLVAQAGFDRLGGRGDFGTASNRNANAMVGVQVNIPLYDGGMSRAQASEGARLLDKAQAQLEAAREQLAEQVRGSWLGWQAGQARIAALQDGLTASAARLDATRTGREVGDRTLMDVLNAENDHARATLALAEARTAQVLHQLRLAALADRLDEARLAAVSTAVVPDVAATSAALQSAALPARRQGRPDRR
ncbi:TolC family protein [Ottowia testudinis]|uniref:TolC family protein n=1 Tax=Ottowia testudinis TaxID=2816950 RepID=A0A975CE83_9BURK|nr:TolC family protein [Ottowia testudinis]QTD44151.1 TolC family protein [Ottowia testudinis]